MPKKINIIQQFGVKIFIPKKGEYLDVFTLQSVLENAMLIHARTTKQEVYEIEATTMIPGEQATRRAVIDELIISVPGPLREVAKAIRRLNNTINRVSRKYDEARIENGDVPV